jgi:subtilase family serine protease
VVVDTFYPRLPLTSRPDKTECIARKTQMSFSTRVRRLLFVVFSIVVLSLLDVCQAQQTLQALHGHVRPAVSSGRAALVGSLPPEKQMNLSIVLPLRNQSELNSLLKRLYDPSSPDYHHFLSVKDFADRFGPTAEDYQKVVDFAGSNGLAVRSAAANRMTVSLTGSVAQVEKAFGVKMQRYQHPTEAREFFSPDREPSVPLNLKVTHIAGLNNFSVPRPLLTKAAKSAQPLDTSALSGSGPGGVFLSGDMRAAYYGGTALTGNGQTVGLVEFDGYNVSDVDLTFSSAGQSYSVPINNVLTGGASGGACQWGILYFDAPCSDAEEVTDIVQAIGIAPGLSQVRVYIGYLDSEILNAVAAENIAKQVSISWGWTPDDPSTDDVFFQEMAAQGQSVFVASGDYGNYSSIAYPYPGEDAYVTTVGGTDLVTSGAGGAWSSETAWSQSGGGVSPDGIAIPSWQAGVANSTNGDSTTLRNVPDVAMEANTDNYYCDYGECNIYTLGGTSLAAPRWAAFMALVNQQATEAGEPTVGFLNPAIYTISAGANYASDLHDITSGSNNYSNLCNGALACNAVPGYDLVTGWGSPTGQALIDALAPPASAGFQISSSVTSLSINPGSSGTTTITVTDQGGFNGSVNLVVSGLPSGMTSAWGTNPTNGTSVLTLTVHSTAGRGSYPVTVTGTSGSFSATTNFTLSVKAPGFAIFPSPGALRIQQGLSIATTIEVVNYAGFSGSVNLAITSQLPKGVTATWSANPTSGSSMLTLSASDTAVLTESQNGYQSEIYRSPSLALREACLQPLQLPLQ